MYCFGLQIRIFVFCRSRGKSVFDIIMLDDLRCPLEEVWCNKFYLNVRFGEITRPASLFKKYLPILELFVYDYEPIKKDHRVIRLESESNTCIFDSLNTSRIKLRYSFFRPFMGHIQIFDSGSSNSTSIHQFYYSASTRLRTPTFFFFCFLCCLL